MRAILELQTDAQGRALSGNEVEKRLSELLADLRVEHLRDSPSVALSGGERRRVEIARALATDPRFIRLRADFLFQSERLHSTESGISFLGLKQTQPERFACHLEALAEPPLSEPMLMELRERFDPGSRIHASTSSRRAPLLQRGDGGHCRPRFSISTRKCSQSSTSHCRTSRHDSRLASTFG